MLPIFLWKTPHISPLTDNENIGDDSTYVKNGTKTMLLNSQRNHMNKIEGLPKLYVHGDGTSRKGMWGKGDVFQFIMTRMYEE